MDDVALKVVMVAGSVIGGVAGGWLALRDRVTAIEHELWGVRNRNGLKSDVIELARRVDAMLVEERNAVARIDRRNRSQHPEEEDDA
jgi:hypothetical protein